ncbi:prolyl-tRNA synthetase [Candidatus Saccharibacteria bacterium]|nr:prolyl-tRNA synthetase [Candidatus Saccharibacteria bacterium]
MKFSQTFLKTLRDAPKDETAKSAQLLTRAGYVYKEMAGVYDYLPLGLKVLENIKSIIRDELNKIGCEEVSLSLLQNPELWQKTNRWSDQEVDIWFKTALAAGGELGLAPTHEEPITNLLKTYLKSYKDLPVYVYQIQTKFRNELRAKSGILRGREFIMKDLYSFNRTEAELDDFYQKVETAYTKIYDRLGIGHDTFETFASGGIFAKYSHEFQTLTDVGEDTVWLNQDKSLSFNNEVFTDEILAEFGVQKSDFTPYRACEVGNIFKLKYKYSAPLDLSYVDQDNQKQTVYMGCYGIGVSRVMGVIAEKFADEKGLLWPKNIAPFKYYLIGLGAEGEKKAAELYAGHENDILFDDREKVRFGEKMGDFELLGIPYCVVVSDKTLAEGKVELTNRATGEKSLLTLADFTAKL